MDAQQIWWEAANVERETVLPIDTETPAELQNNSDNSGKTQSL